MPSLHELQQTFAGSMLAESDTDAYATIIDDGIAAAERLRVYRNTFRSNLTRTLRMVYPAVDKLVGANFFEVTAESFMLDHPPDSGDLNEYGGALPGFLAAFPPARDVPYLADVARFEWALNVAANAADAPVVRVADLAAIAPAQHALLAFTPHPSVSLLALAYPADQIADAVLSGDDAAMRAVDLSSGPVHVVVHRGAQGVEAERLDAPAAAFLCRLYAGESLDPLLEHASDDAPTLLANELTKGRLTRVPARQPARNDTPSR